MSIPSSAGSICIRGARTHNLRNVSLDVPRGALVVFTGPSGSGKSSLVFDTIFAEGQRRFLATLPNLPEHLTPRRPPVDAIEGLPPVLSVSQSAGAPRPRSTLATVTEIHDHLRLLWARRGTPYCPDCQLPIVKHTLAEIARQVLALPTGRKIYLLAPLVFETPGRHADVFQQIRVGGFLRARIDGVLFEIRDTPEVDAEKPHTIDLVVDRLVVREGMNDRLMESLASCARQGEGRVIISDVEETGDWNDAAFSTKLSCPRCRRVLPDLEPRRFHFNTPHGACPRCTGMGLIDAPCEADGDEDEDPPLIVCPECAGTRLNREARAVRYEGVSLLATGRGLNLAEVTALSVAGALRLFQEAHVDASHPFAKVETVLLREIVTRLHFLAEVGLGYLTIDRPAPTLSGGELQRARLATQLGGGLRGVCFILDEPTLGLHPRDTERLIAALRALQERGNSLLVVEHDEAVMRQADYLVDLGPGAGPEGGQILAAGRLQDVLNNPNSVTAPFLRGKPAERGFDPEGVKAISRGLSAAIPPDPATDSGSTLKGSQQPISSQVAATPSGSIWASQSNRGYRCAQPPANGLDPSGVETRDPVAIGDRCAARLPSPPVLRGRGAEPTKIATPQPGTPLTPALSPGVPGEREQAYLLVRGARHHNLKTIDVAFPLARLIAVTGVSGSGKSSLVHDVLARGVRRHLDLKTAPPGEHSAIVGLDQIDALIEADQRPLGRSSRSSAATYCGLFDEVRKVFAQTRTAKIRGYKPNRFSFNARGGRCEECHGHGELKAIGPFLPDLAVPCRACEGRRFNAGTLEVRFKGLSIAEVLALRVGPAREFFKSIPAMARILAALDDVGLGYLPLGQPATRLSGGEAQRVKLAAELARAGAGRTLFILDEPTAGLHRIDVARLLRVLRRLVEAGNTVVVIEHHLDVIAASDWVIDLGPDAGAAGGELVVAGPPGDIANCPASVTGRFLRFAGPEAFATPKPE